MTHTILLSMTILPNSINISAHSIYANTLVNVLQLLIPVSHLKVKLKSLNKVLKERKRNIFLKTTVKTNTIQKHDQGQGKCPCDTEQRATFLSKKWKG